MPGASTYQPDELVSAGHRFFGNVSRGLASVIERAVSQWGLPNGYVLGEEGSGAFVAGLRYGEGTLYTKNAGDLRVYWQGPSVGFDWGGDGARTMTLVYNLPATNAPLAMLAQLILWPGFRPSKRCGRLYRRVVSRTARSTSGMIISPNSIETRKPIARYMIGSTINGAPAKNPSLITMPWAAGPRPAQCRTDVNSLTARWPSLFAQEDFRTGSR